MPQHAGQVLNDATQRTYLHIEEGSPYFQAAEEAQKGEQRTEQEQEDHGREAEAPGAAGGKLTASLPTFSETMISVVAKHYEGGRHAMTFHNRPSSSEIIGLVAEAFL